MKPEDLVLVSLLLGGFALAGGAYGSLFAMGKLSASRLLLWISRVFFGLQAILCAALLRMSVLRPGWKLFLAASLIAYAVLPPLAWSGLERLHGKESKKP